VPKIVVPVGRSCGPEYPVDGGQEVEAYILELANGVYPLPLDAYQTWLAAFADVDAHQQHKFTRDRLAEVATEFGVANAAKVVDDLVNSKLLAEYEPGTDSALEFLRSFKLYPTADGLGNTPDDPSMYRIGRDGNVVLSLQHDIFGFWSGSYHEDSMWKAVVAFDKERPRDAPFTTEELGHLFAASVPAIVVTRSGFVDLP
jgi:hypothetical protein